MALAALPKTTIMENKKQEQPIDPNLDIPAEAARTKHVNFLDDEAEGSSRTGFNEDDVSKRQKEWKEGLEEGERARQNDE